MRNADGKHFTYLASVDAWESNEEMAQAFPDFL
jgi:hypothetical protein